MSIWQRLGLAPSVWLPPTPEETIVPIIDYVIDEFATMPIWKMWERQPYLRTVTTFIARSVASTSLHVFKHKDDGGRERVRGEQISLLMSRPNRDMTMLQFLYAIVLDLCLYDEAIIYVRPGHGEGLTDDEMPELLPISPRWVTHQISEDRIWGLDFIDVQTDRGKTVRIPADKIVRLHGYNPSDYINGTSPVDSLRDLLREQLDAAKYRSELWKNGPQISGVIERPKDAPRWGSDDRKRFKASLKSQYTGRGSGVGGMPLLEDGMTLKPYHLNAKDEQFVDVAKLSLQTVASVYHVNPTMVGLLDNANYSNVREFRRSLYGDSLGPIIKQIEEVFNAFLLPMLGIDSDHYVEFNLDEKLRASFEEKAAVTSAAVGGPWMTRNEARAMNNLTAIDGADELIVPLNVAEGSAGTVEEVDPGGEDT